MSSFAKGFARALQPLVARQRFALQCAAVAFVLTALVALGVTGSKGWNVSAAPGQPDILQEETDEETA